MKLFKKPWIIGLLALAWTVPGMRLQAQTLNSITVLPGSQSIAGGMPQQYAAIGTYSDGSRQNMTNSVTWASTNPAVATINSSGLAIGLVAGSTTIQANYGMLTSSSPLTVTASGLAGYWTFDAGTGTTAADSSGNGNTAGLVNGITWVAGKIGNAVSGNGTNQYVNIPAINLGGTRAVTMMAWVNRTYSTAGGHTLWENSANFNSSTTGFGFFPDDGPDCGSTAPMMAGVRGDVGYTLNCYAQPSSGAWHHIAVIYDKTQTGGNAVALYVDGVLRQPAKNYYSATNTNTFGSNPTYVYSRGGVQEFTAGVMDDLRLYSRALSASEIQQIYEMGNTLSSIAVTPTTASIAVGQTEQYAATGTYSDGSSMDLTNPAGWISSSGAAVVSGAGLVTGITIGSASIQALSGMVSSSPASLTVTPPVLQSITVTPANPLVAAGGTQQFTATGNYSDGTQQNVTGSVTWTSSNTSVTTINSSGLASALTLGSSTIRAAYGSVSGSTGMTVTVALQSISVMPTNASIGMGSTQQFTATGNYSDGSQQNLTNSVTWTSTNTTAATVSATGLATGLNVGSTTIQAVSGAITSSANLTVTTLPPLTSLVILPGSQSIAGGMPQQFTAIGTYSDGSSQNMTNSVTWASTNPAVATINSSGMATGLVAGSATIQANYGTLTSSSPLTVTASGLSGYWTFDAGTGTAAADSSGNGNTAGLVNGITWVAGKIGNAVSGNGTNQYVNIPAVNLGGTRAVTMMAWVNRTYSTAGGHTLWENSANFNSSTTGFGFFPDDGPDCGSTAPMMAGVRGDVGYTLNCYAQPSSGAWHHIAVIYDKTQTGGNAVALYVDGVLQRPAKNYYSATNTNTFGSNPTYVYSRGGVQEFAAGVMDDLRLYSRALSASEIQQIYEMGNTLSSIAVTPTTASIAVGQTEQYAATGTYSDGSSMDLTHFAGWTSSSAAATISGAGTATGAAAGSANIQAVSGPLSSNLAGLTITAATLQSITVTPANPFVAAGGTQQFTATGNYSDGTQKNLTSSVTWTSSNASIATINSAGLASAVSTGTANVQATSGSVSGSTLMTVTATLRSIAVTPANGSIGKGATLQFTATGSYSDGSNQNLTGSVTWTSTNSAAATISASGLATGINVGATTIQAAAGSITGSTGLAVTAPALVSIAVTPANPSVMAGTTQQFTATGTYSDGSSQILTSSASWTSTNTQIATINSAGLATGLVPGTATIQASVGTVSGSTGLTVAGVGQFVQWSAGDSGAASSSTTYQDKSATSGNLILVFSHWDNQSLTATATDNMGNTYIPIGGPVNAGASARFEVWYAKNIHGGVPLAATVTYSGRTTSFSLVDVIEYSGLDQSAPLDVYALATGSGPFQNSGFSPGTTAENDLLIGLFGYASFASPFTPAGGMVMRNFDATSMLEDMSVSSTGSYNATAASNSPPAWVAYVLAFKSALQPHLSLGLNPVTAKGGQNVTGTVTLNAPAPSGGTTVSLASSNSALATVPSSVLIAAGSTTAQFTITTTSPTYSTGVSISDSDSQGTQSETLTIVPASMAQIASDSFNRINASTLGVSWTPLAAANIVPLQIASNKVQAGAAAPGIAKEMYYGGINWTPDQYSQAQIVAAGSGGFEGPAVRMTSNDTYYGCLVSSLGSGNAQVSLVLNSAGSSSTLAASTTATVSAGDQVRCSVQGSTLTMSDQTSGITLLTASDSTLPAGYPGLIDSAGSGALTNYVMANWSGGAAQKPLSPQSLASDAFNRPDALNLGANWHVGPGHGPIQIVGGQIEPYPAGGTQPSKEHYFGYGPLPPDQWSQVQVVNEDLIGDLAAELRASDTADTMYVCDVNLTGAAGAAETRIVRVLNGTITALVVDQSWSTVSPGDYIRGQVQGSLISMVDVTSGQLLLTILDPIIVAGYPGVSLQVGSGTTANHIADNWSGGGFQ